MAICNREDLNCLGNLAAVGFVIGTLGLYGSFKWLQAEGNRTAALALGILSGTTAAVSLTSACCCKLTAESCR